MIFKSIIIKNRFTRKIYFKKETIDFTIDLEHCKKKRFKGRNENSWDGLKQRITLGGKIMVMGRERDRHYHGIKTDKPCMHVFNEFA